jgi:copper chaperone NosL
MSEQTRCVGFAPFILGLVITLLAGCWQGSNTGPGEIHWDRQTCERCQMVISERRHAVQIRRLGEPGIHAFDDLGCALLWLDDQELDAGSEAKPEVWVKEPSATAWVDARVARFEAGMPTPMAYGFGTAEQGISLGEVEALVVEAEERRRGRSAARLRDDAQVKDGDLD